MKLSYIIVAVIATAAILKKIEESTDKVIAAVESNHQETMKQRESEGA